MALIVTLSAKLGEQLRLVCAFILTRIDYCNGVLANLPDSALAPLQRVLHAAARFVAAIGPRDHITPTLILLHWLPDRQRITYHDAFSVLWSGSIVYI